jgi:hypothetical protein
LRADKRNQRANSCSWSYVPWRILCWHTTVAESNQTWTCIDLCMDKCNGLRGNTNLSSAYSEAHCDTSIYLYCSSISEPGISGRTVEE